jgi:hypothetical protein
MTTRTTITLTLALTAGLGCGASQPADTAATDTSTGAGDETAAAAAVAPDRERAVVHLEQHVTYPVSREDLLAACDDTPEFSEGEQIWFREHLPEGTYTDAAAVITALGL